MARARRLPGGVEAIEQEVAQLLPDAIGYDLYSGERERLGHGGAGFAVKRPKSAIRKQRGGDDRRDDSN